MGDLFDGYAPADTFGVHGMGRDVRGRRRAPDRPPGPCTTPSGPAARRVRVPLRGPRSELPGPGHHLPALGRGASVPARPGAAHHSPSRMGGPRGRRRPAGQGAGGVPRRRVRAGARSSTTGWCPAAWSPRPSTSTGPPSASNPPNGVRIHVAGIDVVRGADGRFCVLEDNIRCPVGGLLRDREPADDGPDLPGAVRQPPGPARRRLSRPICSKRCGPLRPPGVERPDRGGAYARACTTRPTSSTPSWPARWASSWSRAAT